MAGGILPPAPRLRPRERGERGERKGRDGEMADALANRGRLADVQAVFLVFSRPVQSCAFLKTSGRYNIDRHLGLDSQDCVFLVSLAPRAAPTAAQHKSCPLRPTRRSNGMERVESITRLAYAKTRDRVVLRLT